LWLLPVASGQHSESLTGFSQITAGPVTMPDSAAADSTGTQLVIPNVFTPNKDGTHDYFEVVTDGVTVYEFNVFTRTGTQVFHSSSPRIFWDGTNSAGLELSEGVYYYVIEEEGGSESYSSTGFIYLFR
jgi:gliding motility-associated-like protein